MKYDLEERTKDFALAVRMFAKNLKYSIYSTDDIRQLIRSSGSIGANYLEANRSLGRNDFIMRIRISRKEASESKYWAEILSRTLCDTKLEDFMKEAEELEKIFGSIQYKYKNSHPA